MPQEKPLQGTNTRAVHGSERQWRISDAVAVPIFQTSTFIFRNTQEIIEFKEGRLERWAYGRYGNPTVRAAERKLAGLEHAEDGLLWASGMCAVTSTLLAMLRSGDHLIVTADCYHRTRQFCSSMLQRLGIDLTLVPPSDPEAIEAAVRQNTRLLFSESPSNPFLHVADLETIAAIAKRHGLCTIIDSTFATPYNQNPFDYGIDLIVHSATKYLGGHNDLMGGAVVGKASMIARLREARGVLGGIMDPHTAYLLLRGIKTLALRIQQHNANGMALARFLEEHPKVRRVYYPGLESHPSHTIARTLLRGFGGVVSFEIDGTLQQSCTFVDALRVPYITGSLGGVESLVELPALMGYYHSTAEERRHLGIEDSLVRYAAGIENTDDLIEDVEQALQVCL